MQGGNGEDFDPTRISSPNQETSSKLKTIPQLAGDNESDPQLDPWKVGVTNDISATAQDLA